MAYAGTTHPHECNAGGLADVCTQSKATGRADKQRNAVQVSGAQTSIGSVTYGMAMRQAMQR